MIKQKKSDSDAAPDSKETSCCRVESVVSVDERGQMVLPKEVREKAGIHPGDKLAVVTWHKEGRVCCLSLIKTDEFADMVKGIMGPMMGGGGNRRKHEIMRRLLPMKKEEIKKAVRNRYGEMAAQSGSCCGSMSSDVAYIDPADEVSRRVGYTDEELKSVPDKANLGLGCGNPVALASLKKGEVVLDLGSGAGFDCFLAAHKVGETGRVIGVDMTPEMVEKARENAAKTGWKNVEFRLGEIENLPAADGSVDVVISNCVINLSPEKERVFAEAFRVLKPGGRLMISDLVLLKDLPDFLKKNAEAYVACVAGTARKEDYLRMIENAGFRDVTIIEEASYPVEFILNDPTVEAAIKKLNLPQEEVGKIGGSLASVKVSAVKPRE